MIRAKSLSIQIWLWFIGCIGISGVIIALIIYGSLEVYLKDQLFSNIEKEQQMITLQSAENRDNEQLIAPTTQAISSVEVKHIVKDDNDFQIKAQITSPAKEGSLTNIGEEQFSSEGRYEDENTYYVITKQAIEDKDVYIYSYAVQNMRKEVLSRFWYVFLAILIVILIMFVPARIIAKRLTKPFIKLGREMESIAKRQWNEPISLKGSEEFRDLAESCESMRQQLVAYDNKQQNMLQSISHELKTPIMVIRSYIQATKDGFYPKGGLNSTLDSIDQEAIRLQKKVFDLVYITNLDYLTTHHKEVKQVDINLKEIIERVYDRLKYRRTDVDWDLELEETLIKGDKEQWKVVFENILQNGLRYSKDEIRISLKKEDDQAVIRIYNNGSTIEDKKKDKLFNAFQKGNDGESGLGLNIVKRTIDLYGGEVWFENEDEGVSFYISIPLNKNIKE
ncbi:HAMP domain-containing sensor histidine kinase [Wukongibacter baidiensis]|uniref:sensor histidine kinase n=1 Tax=Wukongibacter baidiensis TaxID=1723361 RepID=UPI003D7FDDE9